MRLPQPVWNEENKKWSQESTLPVLGHFILNYTQLDKIKNSLPLPFLTYSSRTLFTPDLSFFIFVFVFLRASALFATCAGSELFAIV